MAIFTQVDDGVPATDKTRYLHKDHLGSIDLVTDEAGLAADTRSFDPWGKPRNADWTPAPADPPLTETPRGFTDHEHIQTVGLIHMNGRVQDPVLGRFISADPSDALNPAVGFNRYSYALNNPLSFTDPSGFSLGSDTPGGPNDLSDNPGNWDREESMRDRFNDRFQDRTAVLSPEELVDAVIGAGKFVLNEFEEIIHTPHRVNTKFNVSYDFKPGELPGTETPGPYLDYDNEAQVKGATIAAIAGMVRRGPKGVVPKHHNANVTVRDANGNIISRERVVSGNMTPEEKALGFPKSTLASHTEARAVRNTQLQPGQTMTITGQKAPCPSCKGEMNKAVEQTGADVRYQYREDGRTQVWEAGK